MKSNTSLFLVFIIIIAPFFLTPQFEAKEVDSDNFKTSKFGTLEQLDKHAILEVNLLTLHNQLRKIEGLEPLKLDKTLIKTAKIKADEMTITHCWGHYCPEAPWQSLIDNGYAYRFAGENLGYGYKAVDDLMNAWMKSPTHRSNILNPNFKEVGFAIEEADLRSNKNNILVVVHFGARREVLNGSI